jgi:diadenosine tetraphosphate (Ap4A) HIT family hydrolase
LIQRFNVDAFNIGLKDGLTAGQTVEHAHVHIIPRRLGDVPDARGGIRWVLAETAKYWKE